MSALTIVHLTSSEVDQIVADHLTKVYGVDVDWVGCNAQVMGEDPDIDACFTGYACKVSTDAVASYERAQKGQQ